MTLDEVKLLLKSNNFIVEVNNIPYKFVGDSLNINNKPTTHYVVEETEKGFYLRTNPPISSSNPLRLLIDDTHYKMRITIMDEYNDKEFCTLIPYLF